MDTTSRLAAILLVLLSQWGGAMAVICDEGEGGGLLELLPRACCEAEDSESLLDESCHGCEDRPALGSLQRDEDDDRRVGWLPAPQHAVGVPCAMTDPRGTLVPCAPAAPGPAAGAALVGTVILIC